MIRVEDLLIPSLCWRVGRTETRPRPRCGWRVSSAAVLESSFSVRGLGPALEAALSHQCLAVSWLPSEFSSTQALLCLCPPAPAPGTRGLAGPLSDGQARSVTASFTVTPGSGAGGLGRHRCLKTTRLAMRPRQKPGGDVRRGTVLRPGAASGVLAFFHCPGLSSCRG